MSGPGLTAEGQDRVLPSTSTETRPPSDQVWSSRRIHPSKALESGLHRNSWGATSRTSSGRPGRPVSRSISVNLCRKGSSNWTMGVSRGMASPLARTASRRPSGESTRSVRWALITVRFTRPLAASIRTRFWGAAGSSDRTTPLSASITVRDRSRPAEVRAQASAIRFFGVWKCCRISGRSPAGRTAAASWSLEVQTTVAPLSGISGVSPVQTTARVATSTIPNS